MVDGPNQYSGRIEVYNSYQYHSSSGYQIYPQEWGTICDNDQWTVEDATVVCRSLGYSFNEANLQLSLSYGLGTGPIWSRYITCSGREYYTWECSVRYNYESTCNHNMDVGIICSGKSCMTLYYNRMLSLLSTSPLPCP